MQQNSWLTNTILPDVYHFVSVQKEIQAIYYSSRVAAVSKRVPECSVQM